METELPLPPAPPISGSITPGRPQQHGGFVHTSKVTRALRYTQINVRVEGPATRLRGVVGSAPTLFSPPHTSASKNSPRAAEGGRSQAAGPTHGAHPAADEFRGPGRGRGRARTAAPLAAAARQGQAGQGRAKPSPAAGRGHWPGGGAGRRSRPGPPGAYLSLRPLPPVPGCQAAIRHLPPRSPPASHTPPRPSASLPSARLYGLGRFPGEQRGAALRRARGGIERLPRPTRLPEWRRGGRWRGRGVAMATSPQPPEGPPSRWGWRGLGVGAVTAGVGPALGRREGERLSGGCFSPGPSRRRLLTASPPRGCRVPSSRSAVS